MHIPKTAGSSIESLFADLGDMRHSHTDFYGQIKRSEVVRNPYERLVSEFFWRHPSQRDPTRVNVFSSFDSLIEAIPLDLSHSWSRYMSLADRRHANLLIHLRPQWHYVCDRSRYPDPAVDIVRFERLREDLEPLFRRWRIASRLAQRTVQPRDLADFYSERSLAVVNEVYALDFEWFGYERHSTPQSLAG